MCVCMRAQQQVHLHRDGREEGQQGQCEVARADGVMHARDEACRFQQQYMEQIQKEWILLTG